MKTARKVLSLVLSLALALSLLPGLSVTAAAEWDGNPYAELVPTSSDDAAALTEKQVTFNGKKWYVINDASTAENAGTLTLLYAGTLGNAKFDENNNNYSTSSLKAALDNMTATGAYKNVAEAIKDTENGKLYLLSAEEAGEVPLNVRADFPSDGWWLRTKRDDGTVAYVLVNTTGTPGRIPDNGVVPNTSVVGVRPALQLDLSKVVYDATDKAFYVPATAPTITSVTGTTLVAGYGAGSVSVAATAAEGHTLSYQWYSNTENRNEGGEKINDATSATYNIPTGNAAGEYYYYCVVTATRTGTPQTASATSGVAVVTVADGTDALVEKLAEEKNIDLSQYYLIPAEDMYFTSGQYWKRNNVNGRNVGEDGDYRVATKQFTKEKLPAGSLIFCKAYYAFEAVAWNESSSSVNNETVGKRNHVFTKVGDQFSWWNDYELFGFNLTKYAEGDFSTKKEATIDEISNAFRIYVPKGEAVAKIGDKPYYTLADAVRAAKPNDTIKLLRDATDNLVLTDGKNIVFDLNGYTLTNDGKHSTIVTQKGSTLEVVDNSETNSGKVDNITHSFGPLFNNGGTVTLSGGTFIRSKEAGNGKNSYYTVVNRGTMTINEGVVIGDGKVKDSSLIDNGYSEINRLGYHEIDPNISYGYQEGESSEKAVLTVNGGTFKGGRHTLNNDVNGKATVSGGSFSSSTGNAVYNLGELTISGGTFKAEAEGKFALQSAAESGETNGPDSVSGSATVTGGSFTGTIQKDDGATLTVTGGEFSEELPDGCLAEGGNHALIPKDDKYIAHTHSFIYSVENDATIIATCQGEVCHVDGKKVELTILKPTLTIYGGEGNAAATLTGLEVFNNATALTVSADSIKYYNATENNGVYIKGTEITSGAPTGAGDYLAEITLTGVKTDEGEGKSVTASVGYTIAKASAPDAGTINNTQKPTAKTGDDAVYTGSALALVSAPTSYPEGYTGVKYSTDGGETWSAQIPTATTAGDYTVMVKYTSDNYDDLAGEEITVTISAAAGAISYTTASVNKTYGDAAFKNELSVTGDGIITYSTTNDAVATVAADGEVTIVGAGTATITASVTDGANYTYATKTASYTVNVSKASQTAPEEAPTKASATINSITLTAITNGEYSMDGENWQDSPTFTGLEMNTQYTFYQRYASDANHNASPSSTSATISTSDHDHNFTFSFDQNNITDTITATCTVDDCPLENNQISLKLVPPESLVYSTENPMKARLEGLDAFNEATGLNVSEDDIIDIYLPVCEPYGIGSHTAIIILGDELAPDAAASLKYEISKGMTAIFPTSFFSSPIYGDEDEVYYGIMFSAQPDQDYAITEFGEDVDWENDKVELEPDEDGDGYYFTVKNLEAATKYTVHTRVKAQGENPAGEVKTKDFLTGLSSYHIEGASIVGATLEAMYEPETATGLSYQWYYETRNYNDEEKTSYTSEYSEITDATGKTYTLTEKDIGKFIGVKFIKYDQVIEECSKDGEISQYSTVEFELDYEGGEIEAPTELGYGDKIPEPETPTRAGYVFGGWYADYELTEKWDFEENTIDSDYVVIYAKWTPVYVPTPIITVTVPGSGDAGEESISLKISGDKAVLDSITDAQIASAIGEDGKSFTIDLTGINGNYEFEISKAAGEKIADAVGEDGKAVIWLKESSGGTDAFYGIEAPASISKGSRFWVRHIEPTDSTLTDAVRDYYFDNSQHEQWIIDAGMTSDGKEVHDLGGNTVNLYIAVGDDWNADDMRAVFISEDGKTENVVCEPETVVNQSGEHRYAQLTLNHFSTYILRNMGDCPINEFTDADENAWYHDGVHFVLENKLMSGYGDGKFGPADYTSRAMVAQILWNLEGKPASTYEISYSDVASDAWYADAIRWASEKGIVTGYGDGKFGPDDNITREQLAAIIYRYAQSKDQGFTGMWMFNLDYEDASSVSDWASEAMHWMVMKGIIKGQTEKTLAPKSFASRAEIATMIMRYATLEK